jgi:UDPglucose--hexose-1-phosphate uridylyltransferase
MPRELRKDPTTGRWVLIHTSESRGQDVAAQDGPCPFCPGREALTPPEITAYRSPGSRPNEEGWLVRVFPDRDPYFTIEEDLVREGVGMFDRISARGASEIVVEDPSHTVTFLDADEDQIARVLWMYRDRIQDLKRDLKIRSVTVTRRYGHPTARIRHPYSRVLAAPIIVDDLRAELTQAREYYGYKRRCVYCDSARESVASRDRLVRSTPHFLAFVPYAARVAFELRVLPRRHVCLYEEIGAAEVTDLAQLLRSLLRAVAKELGDPAWEMVLHTAPNTQAKFLPREWETVASDYHWHIEILPDLGRFASVAGIGVNHTLPEEAARRLREAGNFADEGLLER